MSGNNIMPITYKDRILWLVFYPLAALSFIFIANDNPFLKLIQLPSFTTDVAFALLVTFTIGTYLKRITKHLDRKYSWKENFNKRTFVQFCYGVVLPLLVSMTLEIIYLKSINIPIASSSILYLELPLAFLLLLLPNSYYLATFLFYHTQTKTIEIEKNIPLAGEETVPYLVVQKGFCEQKIEVTDCAFIKSSERLLWLHTLNNEIYRLDGTLDDWEEKLKGKFYRINRQYLAASASIQSVSTTETRKLKVHFTIPLADEVYISKANAVSFRKWWKN